MRPPLLSDDAIRAAIQEIQSLGGRVTGVAVRALLQRRYGSRGGVARVYRLVAKAVTPVVFAATPVHRTPSEESREAAIARAEVAEERERVHQVRWAREMDALRSQADATDRLQQEVTVYRTRVAELTRALASAHARIVELERALQSGTAIAPHE